VVLLVKSVQIAHQAGFYLLNGRWHKIHQDKPAPAGAPVLAEKPASGHTRMTSDMWAQVYAHADNSNKATFIKKLDKLKEAFEAGDEKAILAGSYPNDTTNKKVVKVANYLLNLMGSEHTVHPGLKQGTHHTLTGEVPAVSKPVEAQAPVVDATPAQPEHVLASPTPEPVAEAPKVLVTAPVAATDNKKTPGQQYVDQLLAEGYGEPTLYKDGPKFASVGVLKKPGHKDVLLNPHQMEYAQQVASQPAEAPSLPMPNFVEGKNTTGVVDYYAEVAKKVQELHAAGDVAGLEQLKADGLEPNKNGKVGNTWKGKTENSKMLLAMQANAVAQIGGAALSAPVPAPVEAAVPARSGKPSMPTDLAGHQQLAHDVKNALDSADHTALDDILFQTEGATPGSALDQVDGYAKAAKAYLDSKGDGGKPVKPAVEPSASQHWAEVVDEIETAINAGDIEHLQMKVSTTAGLMSAGAQASHAYAQAGLDYLGADSTKETPVGVAPAAASEAPYSLMATIGATTKEAQANQYAFDYLKEHGTTPATVDHVIEALNYSGYQNLVSQFKTAKDKAAKINGTLPGIGALVSAVGNAGSASSATSVAVNFILKNGDTPKAYDAAVMALMAHGYDGAAKAVTDGKPKEGDTKPGADGMLILKDGHWVKMDQGAGKQQMTTDVMAAYEQLFDDAEHAKDAGKIKAALAEIEANYTGGKAKTMLHYGTVALQDVPPQAEATTAQTAVHPIDAVPMPDLSNLMQPLKAQASLDLLKQQIKDHGVSALKGITKKMKASGKVITSLTAATTGKPYKITGYDGNGQSHDAIYHYVEALKEAAGKAPAKPKAKPAAPAAAPKAVEPAHPSMDDWKQIGPQGGSNPGGKFIDPDGVEWYCKFPGDENMAKSEVLAAKLYAAAGISAQDAKLVTKDGKIGIASKWADVSKGSPAQLAKAKGAKAGFAVDAWLANHDVVGLEFDNLQLDANGNAMRVDAGGSLEYRAQGAKKEFGDTVTEIDTLRDKSINDKSAAVFGKMTKADITASVANVLKVSSAQIYALVNTYGPGSADDKVKLAATLIARKADLLAKYPKAKKEKKIEFKPENISAPPSFTNWGGSGNSGPSSKEFINQANEKAVQSIYVAAQTGNPESIKGLSADTFNKATGEVTGAAPVLEHPSQHVKGYAQQAMNEIHQQLNPPKVFRFDGGHPLHSLNAAYPALNSGTHGETVAKAGKFLVLGAPGLIDLPALGLEKASWANGQLDQKTYSPAALAIVNSMPVTQKQAIISYTGAGYGAMNTSLWSGNPTGASKSAAEALNTLGHEIKPGTILSRKLSLSGIGLDQILASTGKILQEPAIMSTSIRPSSWSGNTQLKLHVGPGVKGLWVGKGSTGGSGGLSQHQGEDEMVLPPNTRILVLSVKKVSGPDEDGFGNGVNHVIEAVILPSEQPGK
jgi:hypothetical protein